MRDEIRQQPETLARTLSSGLKSIEKFRAAIARNRPRLVVLAARGTSDNAAQFGRYLIEITTGIPVALAAPSIHTVYEAKLDYTGALVAGISQSGESTDTNIVLEQAKAAGAITVGITNESGSAMAKIADHLLLVRAGPEKSVAATKTYTGQVMQLYLLAYALGAKLRIADLQAVPDLAASALSLEEQVSDLAGRYRFMHHAVVVGRGLNYSNAFEFALKLMETCYVVAERFSAADFLHGPIAMVEPNFPAFLFTPAGPVWTSMRETLQKLKDLKAETFVITDRGNPSASSQGQRAITIPVRIPEIYTPIPYIIPAQLFSAALAKEKNLDPDRPRTLSKITRTL